MSSEIWINGVRMKMDDIKFKVNYGKDPIQDDSEADKEYSLQEIVKAYKRYQWWTSEGMKDREAVKIYNLINKYTSKYGWFNMKEFEEALEKCED